MSVADRRGGRYTGHATTSDGCGAVVGNDLEVRPDAVIIAPVSAAGTAAGLECAIDADAERCAHLVFDAAVSCLKWFRLASVRRILAYETLSETEFGINPDSLGFRPNVFMDVHAHLSEKSEILGIFADEIRAFPFPRSIDAVRALALLRGATAGCGAAEAFMLLKEII